MIQDLVVYAFTTLRGYLTGRLIAASIADIPGDSVQRREPSLRSPCC